jgi:hypothetical protein
LSTKKFAIYEPKNHEVDVNTLNKVKGYLWQKFIYMVF